MNIIETHAHLYDELFLTDLNGFVEKAKNENVSQIWMPNCDVATIEPMLAIEKQYPNYCKSMLGLHPCYVKEDFENQLKAIETYISKNNPIAIGEIGMDLYWDKTFVNEQKEAFKIQCSWAIKNNLWIDIHSRNAFWETIDLIEEIGDRRLKGIFHCFSGNYDEALKAIEYGYLLGIGGVITFKNGGLDKFIDKIDPKHIVLETDSPYLAPVPHRGKPNEPAFISLVLNKLANIYQMDSLELANLTTKNALALIPKEQL